MTFSIFHLPKCTYGLGIDILRKSLIILMENCFFFLVNFFNEKGSPFGLLIPISNVKNKIIFNT